MEKQQTLFDYNVKDYLLNAHQQVEANKAAEALPVKEIYNIIDQLMDILKSSFLLPVKGYKYHEIADLMDRTNRNS